MLWKEFWSNQDPSEHQRLPIFKTTKVNYPRNHKTPQELKNYLAAVKSELLDPQNRNKSKPNLPKDEMKALLELIKLQKSRKIVIKPCDKGAGIMILDFQEYMKCCVEHLESKTSSGKAYYKRAQKQDLEKAKEAILKLVEEGFNNNILTQNEYLAMKPEEDAKPGRFYATLKVHKDHEEGKAPPVRPIVSQSGSLTENIALFVETHLKEAARKHNTYLEDTPDFLRKIKTLTEKEKLPDNAILAVIDVVGLYTNIPTEEGVKCVEDILEENPISGIPGAFITRLLEVVLKNNIFEFDKELWIQNIGTAMGARPAPSYANIFMDKKIDRKLWKTAQKLLQSEETPLKFMKRFLDDIFAVFTGTVKELHKFFSEINLIHPSIKFTLTHTTPKSMIGQCECVQLEAVPFLDTKCTIKDGQISTDLYKKPTDQNQYLLPDSCHHAQVTESIPYSLCLRIVRICSEEKQRELRFVELKEMLLQRGNIKSVVCAAIAKARDVPRHVALRKVTRHEPQTRPVFVVTYDPRLPAINPIISKHWRAMINQDEHLKEVFSAPPMVAYKRQRNQKDLLVKAKVAAEETREKRPLLGMKKCGNCKVCPYIKEQKSITHNKRSWKINSQLNCQSTNVVYIVECDKENCQEAYIGETYRNFEERVAEHLGYARTKDRKKITGFHFNLPGHSMANMKFSIIEKVKTNDQLYRKEREKFHINKFNTHYKGLNKKT